jgi:hypothetical protein
MPTTAWTEKHKGYHQSSAQEAVFPDCYDVRNPKEDRGLAIREGSSVRLEIAYDRREPATGAHMTAVNPSDHDYGWYHATPAIKAWAATLCPFHREDWWLDQTLRLHLHGCIPLATHIRDTLLKNLGKSPEGRMVLQHMRTTRLIVRRLEHGDPSFTVFFAEPWSDEEWTGQPHDPIGGKRKKRS